MVAIKYMVSFGTAAKEGTPPAVWPGLQPSAAVTCAMELLWCGERALCGVVQGFRVVVTGRSWCGDRTFVVW